MFSVFKWLAKGKVLRGTVFDVFGYTEERKIERAIIDEYQQLIEYVIELLTEDNYNIAVEIAQQAQFIRGYGHVKEENIKLTRNKLRLLKQTFDCPGSIIYQEAL
jgi:indolepyruvate ferredoxin oxidoreductase